jgi:hypothetical protein
MLWFRAALCQSEVNGGGNQRLFYTFAPHFVLDGMGDTEPPHAVALMRWQARRGAGVGAITAGQSVFPVLWHVCANRFRLQVKWLSTGMLRFWG